MQAIKVDPPLWKLLDHPLTEEQQHAESEKFGKTYSIPTSYHKTTIADLQQLLVFCHLAALQYEVGVALEKDCYYALFYLLTTISVTGWLYLRRIDTIRDRDVVRTAVFIAGISPLVLSMLTIRSQTVNIVLVPCYLFSAFTRWQPRSELITLSEIVLITVSVFQASLLLDIAKFCILLNVSIWYLNNHMKAVRLARYYSTGDAPVSLCRSLCLSSPDAVSIDWTASSSHLFGDCLDLGGHLCVKHIL